MQYNQAASPLFTQYTTLLTVVGILLTTLGVICRYHGLGDIIAKICMAILFFQPCFFLYHSRTLQHPTTMLFPLLCFLSTPVLGIRGSYIMATAGAIAVFGLSFLIFPQGTQLQHLSSAGLISVGIFFSAYISSVLWKSVLKREEGLKVALSELKEKSNQIEQWAQQLAGASSLINEGSMSLPLPNPPPHSSFKQLTESIEEMQKKLGRYFGQIVIRDRLNSMGVLATGLAHEMNTPLTSIRFLLDTHKGEIPDSLLRDIEDEVKRMGAITRDFLNFTSPHQDGEVIDLNSIIDTSFPFLDRLHNGRAKLQACLTKEALPIKAVKTQLEQVLLNIFKNSLDAASKDNQLVFKVTTEKLPNGQCTLKLEDNGSGIPKEVIPKIFDPFYTTKETGKGTGLGLYIVQEIVNSHQGAIGVESRPQKGTIFLITFPLQAESMLGKAA